MSYNEEPEMESGKRLLSDWTEDLADYVIQLRRLQDSISQMHQEMSGIGMVVSQFLPMAALDIPFLIKLFLKIDIAILITALDRTDKATLRKFSEAMDYIAEHRDI